MPNKYTTDIFIQKSIEIHGNPDSSFIDYSETIYNGSDKPIKLICLKDNHGDYIISHAGSHLKNKQGCPICSGRKLNNDIFIQKSIEIHGHPDISFIDYSQTHYIGSNKPIKLICLKDNHGEFIIPHASSHITKNIKQGCPICSGSKITSIDFINNLKIIHKNNNYNFDNIIYLNMKDKINVFCNEIDEFNIIHGDWTPTAQNFLNGSGCPKCNKILKISKTESEIVDFIKSLDIKNIKLNDRKILSDGKELDIYLPDYNLAIEFNGLYWHSDVYKEDKYHLLKTEECLKQGIQLIHIFEDEWINKQEVVKSRLLSLINKIPKNKTIYARKCYVKEITNKLIVKDFLERNHIQGSVGNKVSLGLYLPVEVNGIKKEYLVSIMTFGSFRKNLGNNNTSENDYELLRFCNVINYSVVGGASKLLKYFEVYFKPENIISYADKRWSKGNLYDKLNFQLSHVSPPNYFYVDGLKRYNRFNYRKDILISKYGCLHEDTERNFTKNVLLLNRIYDSGTLVYKKTYNQKIKNHEITN